MAAEQGFDVVARALVDNGADSIFGLLGDANLAPIARAVQLGAHFYSCRNESASVSMAAGAAVATGEVTFTTVTRGPGLTNALTGLVSAVRDRVPLVFVVGDTPVTDRWSPQNVDHAAVAEVAGAGFLICTDKHRLAASVAQAKELARSGGRPVILDIPTDLLHSRAEDQVALETARIDGQAALELDSAAVLEAARLLCGANRPLIVAGRGAAAAGAGEVLVELAEATGALLTTSLPGAGLFADEPWNLGIAGGLALRPLRELMGQADVVFAVGTSLNNYITLGGMLFAKSTVIQTDSSPEAIGRQHRADVGVVGDAAEVSRAVLAAARQSPRSGVGYRTPDVSRTIAEAFGMPYWVDESGDEGVDPRTFLRALEQGLPGPRRYFVDNGAFMSFPCQVLRPTSQGRLVPCLGFGAVGLSLATAIGAALGRPDETMVAILGDGGMLMSMTELETVARLAPRLVIAVLNDGSYRAEVHHMHRHGLPSDLAEFPMTDFAAVAGGFGVPAVTIDRVDQLEDLPGRLAAGAGPLLIDVHVNPNVIAEKWQVALARAEAERAAAERDVEAASMATSGR